MEKEEFFESIQKKSEDLNIHFSVEQQEQFFEYMKLLIEWNKKMNLTTIVEPEEIILKHFIVLKAMKSSRQKSTQLESRWQLWREQKKLLVFTVLLGILFYLAMIM